MPFSRTFRVVPEGVREWERFFKDLQNDPASILLSAIEHIASNSVVGNPTAAAASPTVIQATVNNHVLRLSAGTLGFGFITSASVSDFTEAAQDAVGATLTDSARIDFTYDDALASITADIVLASVNTNYLTDGAVTDPKLRDSTALSVIGRSANSSGDPADIAATAASGAVLRESGSTIGFGTIATAGLTDGSVTLAKMADLAQSRIIGRAEGAGTGVPTALTPTEVATIIDQEAITWTGTQLNNGLVITGTGTAGVSSGASVLGRAQIRLNDTGAAADDHFSQWVTTATTIALQSLNDARTTTRNAYLFTKSGGAWSDLSFGNTTNNPTYSFLGTGTATFSGQVTALRFVPTSSTAGTNSMYLSASNELSWSTNSAKQLTLTSDGRLYGISLHNNAGAVTGTTNQYIASGTYTPTLTNVANLAASTAYQCQWMRVGNVVTVSGKADVDPSLAATSTQLGISLPIASNLANAEDCAGTAFASGIAGQGAAILGDTANDRAQMQWVSGDITNQAMYFQFMYEVL